MTSLAPKLKSVILQHVEQASPEEIIRVVGSLCGSPANEAIQVDAAGRSVTSPRFVKLGAGGRPLDREDEPHVAVYDRANNLTWSRSNVGSGRMNWKDADAACRALSLAGHQDWRLPTIQELLSIVDYERSAPVIDTSLFDCEVSWYWTSTPAAASPAACAWCVNFSSGNSIWGYRGGNVFARAVRAGISATSMTSCWCTRAATSLSSGERGSNASWLSASSSS